MKKNIVFIFLFAFLATLVYGQRNGSIPHGLDFTGAAEKSIHAVVHIKTEFERKSSVYDDFFGFNDPFFEFFGFRNQPKRFPIVATGSGVIISADGYIVTNNHVVQDANMVTVTLNDKREFEAEIIGTDPSTDLALIKIQGKNLPILEFANSDDVRIGEWVLAVGNPFNLTSTVTAGIVSAKARNLNILGKSGSIESFIQTDAAVNQGNSGGALVNTSGQLIGINAAIASRTGSFSGYSFAIPSNIVKKVTEDIKLHGIVQQAYLGASFSEINSKLATELKLEEIKGIYISHVDQQGSAYAAGIREGDILLSLNNHNINSYAELKELLAQFRPGDKIEAVIQKNNRNRTIIMTLRNKSGNTDVIKKEHRNQIAQLGASFGQVDTKTRQNLRIRGGVQVVKVENGIFKSAGIREGFIILSINRKPVENIEQIEEIVSKPNGSLLIDGIYPNGMKVYYAIGM
jgi:serine protease Do